MHASREDYDAAYIAACRVEGYGADTAQVLACPFCCAPDYQRVRVLAADEDITAEAICSKCERGTKGLITRSEGGTFIEIVQTRGPDIDLPWLPPIRRVEEA